MWDDILQSQDVKILIKGKNKLKESNKKIGKNIWLFKRELFFGSVKKYK